MHKQIAINKSYKFDNLVSDNIAKIAEYCTNGMVNKLLIISKFTKNSVNFTPYLSTLRNQPDSLQIRHNFKLDVRELGYGQKIPAYMFDECRVLSGYTCEVRSVIELSNGKLATGSWDSTIRIWNFKNKRDMKVIVES